MSRTFTVPADQIDTLLDLVQSGRLEQFGVTGISFHGADLRGRELVNRVLTGIDLESADLRSADLQGTNLTNANLSKADLRGADLRGANLTEAVFVGAIYDESTKWPEGFNVRTFGAIYEEHIHQKQSHTPAPNGVSERWRQSMQESIKPRWRSATWVLPAMVTIALLAVLGYSSMTLLPRLWNALVPPEGTPAEEAAGATPSAVAAVGGEVAPTSPLFLLEEALVMPMEAPPPQESTPEMLEDFVQQLFGTVTSTYGVNARSAPDENAEVVRVILQGEMMFVLGEDGDFLRLFLTDSPLAEGQPITGTIAYAAKDYFAVAEQPIRRALREAVFRGAGLLIAGAEEPTPMAIFETTTATETLLLPTPTPSPLPGEAPPPITTPLSVTLTVSAVNGLNVRTNPEIAADIVSLLENGATVDVIGRYVDGNWYKVRLPDGSEGWVASEFVVLNGDPTALPVTRLEELPLRTPAPTITPTVAVGEVTPVPPPAPYVATLAESVTGVVVPTANGVNVRTEPNTEAPVIETVSLNAALPAVGRSADALWIMVELPGGGRGWLFRAAIVPNADLDTLPLTEGEAAATPAATPAAGTPEAATPEATPEAGATPTPPAAGASATVSSIVAPIYAQPSTEAERLEVVPRGTTMVVTGRNEEGNWVQVLSRGGAVGWAPAGSVSVNVDITTLPVVP